MFREAGWMLKGMYDVEREHRNYVGHFCIKRERERQRERGS